MTAQQLLEVGSKLIGLYFLALSAPILLSVTVGWLFSNMWHKTGGAQTMIYISISTVGLLVLMVFGWVLIRATDFVLRHVFKHDRELSESRDIEMFTIGVKLFGAFLAMSEFLEFTRLLSNFSLVSSIFSDHGNIAESIGIATNFIPALVAVLFGLLLFFRGELLSNWAFAERTSISGSNGNG
jgi:hypothetical protein